jgi:hypothetical protein
LGLVWALAFATDGLNLLIIPLLVIACLVYTAGVSLVGLWFSAASRSSQRAVLGTLLAPLGLIGGPWIPWLLCSLPASHAFMQFQIGLTPPLAIAFLTLGWDNPKNNELPHALLGLFVWAIGTFVLWAQLKFRFADLIGQRTPIRRRTM